MSKLELKECPICSNNRFKPVLRKIWHSSSFVQCRKCRLIFQNPQETSSKTSKRYLDEYFKYELSNQHNFFNLIRMTLESFKIYDLIPAASRVLEIGSATGLFLQHMENHGHTCTGLEICPKSVEYGKREYGVDLIPKKLEETDFPEESFDFIHFSHLIEHLNDPAKFLQQVKFLLKPGGLALITTPDSSGLFSGLSGESWRCIVDDHLFLFNKKNLRQLAIASGLQPVLSKTWGSIPSGKAPRILKSITDWFVKATGTGDVVAWLCRRPL